MKNKGYSLVELVVVILIMSIIAIALAPQIMKWVENSRISVDFQNYDAIVSAASAALADERALKESLNDSNCILLIGQRGVPWHIYGKTVGNSNDRNDAGLNRSGVWEEIGNQMDKILGSDWQFESIMKSNSVPDAGYQILIEDGVVYRVVQPSHEDNHLFDAS